MISEQNPNNEQEFEIEVSPIIDTSKKIQETNHHDEIDKYFQ